MGMRRALAVASCAVAVVAFSAGSAFAGEITGNGKPLWTSTDAEGNHTLHGNSACAFSGQEDLQYLDDDSNPLDDVVKGEPAHSQNWGHVKQASGMDGGAGPHGCNPHVGE